MTSEALPEPVADLVGELVGTSFTTLPLGGMSGAHVTRATGASGSVVVKAGASPRETAVYRSLAPVLAAAGIRIPRLHRSLKILGESWLLLEDIPAPLPRDRWLADREVLATLRRLHRLPPAILEALPSRFGPRWTDIMTDAAVRWLDDSGIARRLSKLRDEAAPLFLPHGVISGDPNPLNWGIRGAGELVLMDWERIGLGHPAIDIAITIPGLPTLGEFDRVAAVWRSLEPNGSDPAPPIEPRDLVLAKLWTVIELLADTPPVGKAARGQGPIDRRHETAAVVAGRLPDWLRRVT